MYSNRNASGLPSSYKKNNNSRIKSFQLNGNNISEITKSLDLNMMHGWENISIKVIVLLNVKLKTSLPEEKFQTHGNQQIWSQFTRKKVYYQINLLANFSKIFKRLIYNFFFNFFLSNKFLTASSLASYQNICAQRNFCNNRDIYKV